MDVSPRRSFSISKTELERRNAAFSALETSLFLSLCLFTLIFFLEFVRQNLWLLIFASFIPLYIFIIAGVVTELFFQRYQSSKFTLTKGYLERKTFQATEKINLSEVSQISIKYTSRGYIREIGLWLKNGRNVFMDGLDDFQKFKKTLVACCKNVPIKESHEPFDYDHPMFYPLLGFVLGLLTIISARLLVTMDLQQFKIINLLLALYTFLLGGYFLLSKPLTKRYGYKQQISDYFFAALMLAGTAITCFLSLN